jgi:death on curing protein
MNLNYITVDYAISTHDKILSISGGIGGIKNMDYIESPLGLVRNDDYYPEFEDKLTHLVYSFNKLHGFNDGNKRTSIALGTFFIILNGLEVFADKFIIEMENVAVAVADNLISKDLLREIIYSIFNEEEYNEEIKLKIINALSVVANYTDVPPFTREGSDFYYNCF